MAKKKRASLTVAKARFLQSVGVFRNKGCVDAVFRAPGCPLRVFRTKGCVPVFRTKGCAPVFRRKGCALVLTTGASARPRRIKKAGKKK